MSNFLHGAEKMIIDPKILAEKIDVSLLHAVKRDNFDDKHVHKWTIPETTIAQVIAGRYEVEHAGGHFFVEPGEMYLVQANTTVSITHYFVGGNRMEAQWVRFGATIYKTNDLMRLFEMPLKLDGEPAKAIGSIISELIETSAARNISSQSDIRTYLTDAYRIPVLMYRLVEIVLELSVPRSDALMLLNHAGRMAPVLEYIHAHLYEAIHVEDLAKVAFMSESHFYAEFKQAFGQSPVTYIRSIRIREACRMLLYTQRKIQDIAEATGYGNAFYFCRAFKSVQGVSPKEYRKLNSILIT